MGYCPEYIQSFKNIRIGINDINFHLPETLVRIIKVRKQLFQVFVKLIYQKWS